ncbi:MAG TPA: hypothetical protein VLQ89_01275, partial [Candidatus Binatia bacterium]|nr:hypothetical protein [Candidatus Binatia bacterium]
MSISRATPLRQIKGIGPSYSRILTQRGIASAGDLLLLFPETYLDFSQVTAQPVVDEERLYAFDVESTRLSRNFKKRISLLTVKGRIASLPVRLIFFNRPYLLQSLQGEKKLYVLGRIEDRAGVWQMVNPQLAPENRPGAILPRYRPLEGLKGGTLRKIIAGVLADWRDEGETLPDLAVQRHGFPSLTVALRAIHHPRTLDAAAIDKMKARFIYGEFLFFQLELQTIRRFFGGRARIHRYRFDNEFRQTLNRRLPFVLSAEQTEAFGAIVNDLNAPQAMRRLLQGEVGSGKTIVAFMA